VLHVRIDGVDYPTHGAGPANAGIARQILREVIAGHENRYQLADVVPGPSGHALAGARQ